MKVKGYKSFDKEKWENERRTKRKNIVGYHKKTMYFFGNISQCKGDKNLLSPGLRTSIR